MGGEMFASYNDLTIGNFFDTQLKKYPDKVIQIFENGVRQTYAQLNDRGNRLANGLLRLGLKKGDFVALYAMNCLEYMEFSLATARIGVVGVLLNCFLPKERIASMMEISGAKAIIYEDQYQEIVEFCKARVPMPKHYIMINRGKGEPGENVIDYNKLIHNAPDHKPGVKVAASDPYILLFTTGTTGEPKGVLKSMGGLFFHVLSNNFYGAYHTAAQKIGSPPYCNLRHLVVPPLFHIGPLAYPMYCFMMLRSMVVMRKFDPEKFLWLIDREKVNGVWIQPAMLYRIKQLSEECLAKYDCRSILAVICGGGPIKMAEVDDMMKFFPNATFSSNYGSTETGSAALVTGDELNRTNEKNLGLPSLGADLKIEDEEGNELPKGKEGRIWITCPGLPINCEYYKNPAKTKESFKDGWVFLGDLGYQDDEGYTYYTGREIEFIKSGGEKISPLPIQSVLLSIKEVLAAEVVGVPDEKWGEAVQAVVIKEAGSQISEEEIIQYCKGRLAKYEVPKSVDFVDSYPVGPTGKVLRKELKARYANRETVPGEIAKKDSGER
jgi:acyl-CoA synthetase (AMP-forming)/AMP-acid ligase II